MRIASPHENQTLPGAAVNRRCPEPGSEAKTRSRSRRRGVTALEYLVCLSFILVVLIVAVQHIGAITGGMFSNSANATTTQ